MKYRFENLTIEAVDEYVRISNGIKTQVSKRQAPPPTEVAQMVADMRGYWPEPGVLQGCARAAADAARNKITIAL